MNFGNLVFFSFLIFANFFFRNELISPSSAKYGMEVKKIVWVYFRWVSVHMWQRSVPKHVFLLCVILFIFNVTSECCQCLLSMTVFLFGPEATVNKYEHHVNGQAQVGVVQIWNNQRKVWLTSFGSHMRTSCFKK